METWESSELNSLLSAGSPSSYKKGEVIIRAEDDPSGIFHIISGYVRCYSLSEEGKELTMDILKPGSSFPLTWAIGNVTNSYFYEAMTDSQVTKTPRDKVLQFVRGEPEIFYGLTKNLLSNLDNLLIRMGFLLRAEAKDKIYLTLELLAENFGQTNPDCEAIIKLPLTHQDIANLTGLTRETTSIELNKLEKRGLISRKDKLWVMKDNGNNHQPAYNF
jgi:CRP/FNR family transcriptional regulator